MSEARPKSGGQALLAQSGAGGVSGARGGVTRRAPRGGLAGRGERAGAHALGGVFRRLSISMGALQSSQYFLPLPAHAPPSEPRQAGELHSIKIYGGGSGRASN